MVRVYIQLDMVEGQVRVYIGYGYDEGRMCANAVWV